MNSATTKLANTRSSNAPTAHVVQNTDSMIIGRGVLLGMFITTICFLPLGLMIGYSRLGGSFFEYGFASFLWPIISTIALGLGIGGSLGYVFGVITAATHKD